MRLRWSKYALKRYSEQIEYIAMRNAQAAVEIEEAFERALQNILRFPEIGHKGRRVGTLELIINDAPLILIYRLQDKGITILNILHTSQEYP